MLNLIRVLFIVCVILVGVFIVGRYISKKINPNIIRHKTKAYSFAHFSAITHGNKWLYPELMFTHPVTFVLNKGDTLYIPAGWWHWVQNENETFAINFWYEQKPNTQPISRKPTKLNDFVAKHVPLYDKLPNLLKDMADLPVEVWFSDNDTKKIIPLKEINNQNGRPLYVITLKGYQVENDEFKDRINELIVVPDFLKKMALSEKVDYNSWYTSNKHDTSNHKDDREGILSVLSGSKTVVMYPPSDSWALHPFSVVPNWGKNSATRFYYNAHTPKTTHFDLFENARFYLRSNFSSGNLLYESLLTNEAPCYTFSVISTIYDLMDNFSQYNQRNKKNKTDQLIWGWKKNANGSSRWEIYLYMTGRNAFNFSQILVILDTLGINNDLGIERIKAENDSTNGSNDTNGSKGKNSISVVSIDLHADRSVVSHDLHIYSGPDNTKFPVIGDAKTYCANETAIVSGGKIIQEASFIMSSRTDWFCRHIGYFATLGVPFTQQRRLWEIMQEKKCEHLILFHKYTESQNPSYLVLYCDVPAIVFDHFCKQWNFELKGDDERCLRDYNALVHEIGIGIDNNMNIHRAAIYGSI